MSAAGPSSGAGGGTRLGAARPGATDTGRRPLRLFLSGDVMLGRGVDQVLAHPVDPLLHESFVTDARQYVALAEAVNGAVPRPVDDTWPWGDALALLDAAGVDVRIVNLETSVTRSEDYARGKAVTYRMAPENLGALLVARPDVCVLANNHVLDYGRSGLEETLAVLARAGLRVAGAGRDLADARRPAVVPLPEGRIVVVAVGSGSAGVPGSWAAGEHRAGVHLVDLTESAATEVVRQVRAVREPGDVVVVSVHWGSNWGYEVPTEQVRFAHALVDGGVDLVHGHSSHHPRPMEVYRGRLVLYGCGDLVNDYEGISGHESFRDDLRLLYLATVERSSGHLLDLEMVPMQARRLRLVRAAPQDAVWLARTLTRTGAGFGSRVELTASGALRLVAG